MRSGLVTATLIFCAILAVLYAWTHNVALLVLLGFTVLAFASTFFLTRTLAKARQADPHFDQTDGRWAVSLSRALHEPRYRLTCSAVCTLVLAFLIGYDWLVRAEGGASFLAPTATALWLAVGLGTVVGALVIVLERFLLVHRRAEQLAFHRSTYWERLSWKHQRANLLLTCGLLLLAFAVLRACAHWQVSPLPLLLAWVAVASVGNRRLAASFKAELDSGSET
jgi:hypothetical protein